MTSLPWLFGDKEYPERQLGWALSELRSNDERNREMATEIAEKHGIRVEFMTTEWRKIT